MSHGNPFIFTYSSGFGALALQLKQTRENYCSNWASLDWGKREWPPVGTIGEGGFRGVKFKSELTSRICNVCIDTNISCAASNGSYCSVLLKRGSSYPGAAIIAKCLCNKYKFSVPTHWFYSSSLLVWLIKPIRGVNIYPESEAFCS